MIIIKVINQKLVQVAVTNQGASQLLSPILATKNKKHLAYFARNLYLSATQSQKITNANNQQLIPIARNISFRQCRQDTSAQSPDPRVLFNISSSNSASNFACAHLEPSIFDQQVIEDRESPLTVLKRKAKDAVEKREQAAKSQYYGQSFNETLSTSCERRLVVLMSWLEAKEKHIEKYRQFYLDRGFDVLNVKTSPLDLLLPNVGAKKISKDFVRFMVDKQYSDVVLHGFSVGGYMFGQVLLDIDKQEEGVKQKVLNSIRGLVFDSLVPFEGTCIGVSRSITQNKALAKVIEYVLKMYLVLGHNIATKYYLEASEKVWGGPLKCPSLFIMSKDDVISDHKIIERLASVWSKLGLETQKMVVDSAPHVQIYQKHQEEYVNRIEKFLKHIKIN